MVSTAFVLLWGSRVGAVAWDSVSGIGSFEFDPRFLQGTLDVAPIIMPLKSAEKKVFVYPEHRNSLAFRGLPGLLADMLPDKYGNALINVWLARQGRPADSLNPVEMLSFIGTRGMGALEIEPAIPKSASTASKIEIGSLIDLAERILSGRIDFTTNIVKNEEKALVDILKIGTSAGGARAKAVVAFNPSSGEMRSGQATAPHGFSHWLIKFDGVTDRQFGASGGYGRVEMAYYTMALDAGIAMMPSRLLEENGRAHFLTQRFDREEGGEKLHMQSFCALRHYDFNRVDFYSYEQLFETMRLLRLPYPQAEQLYRRMVFNVMGRNCDDHTKNFAFVMDKSGTWQLSPAYDVCYAYRPGSAWVSQHALSINGKREKFTKDDLLMVARRMSVKQPERIIDAIAGVITNWKRYAEGAGVVETLTRAIGETLIII